ncbi:uncharacterized protein PV06_04449 [Exophiala oligosperma]|uniref:Uncharacterized protein n=2 Tax=Chaetothyriales TaxID=34395 RepID=A0A0D2C0V7_9EURO|nr:uncharacterized protein PV06_04449 [Exophiala oligosperma]KIW43337.1 hypothetical protein PV06_04449 [Exophiala oligosperma]
MLRPPPREISHLQDYHKHPVDIEIRAKIRDHIASLGNFQPACRSQATIPCLFQPQVLPGRSEAIETMADGRNEARAMRILEVMNDFRTLQIHISSLITRNEAHPPDRHSYYLDGYVVLRQSAAESQAILATHFNPGNIGLQAGQVDESEVTKATMQRIILDACTRRFQAHKIYLRASAAMRWVQMRIQLLRGEKPGPRHVNSLRAIDQRLRQELNDITDEHVVGDLRNADRRKGYWIDEDPTLDRMLSWIRMQR